jgi:hypothetical protein
MFRFPSLHLALPMHMLLSVLRAQQRFHRMVAWVESQSNAITKTGAPQPEDVGALEAITEPAASRLTASPAGSCSGTLRRPGGQRSLLDAWWMDLDDPTRERLVS